MKTLAVSIYAGLIAVTASAGPEYLIKQRAKDLRDQNNAQQGVQPAAPAPVQPQKPATQTPATPSPAQQSMARFQASLAEIKAGATLDTVTKQKLARELSGAAQYKKPSQAAVDKLVTAVFNAMSAKPLFASSRAKLVLDIDAILNPAKYPQAKMPAIYEDAQAILKSGGVPVAQAAEVNTALRALGDEVK